MSNHHNKPPHFNNRPMPPGMTQAPFAPNKSGLFVPQHLQTVSVAVKVLKAVGKRVLVEMDGRLALFAFDAMERMPEVTEIEQAFLPIPKDAPTIWTMAPGEGMVILSLPSFTEESWKAFLTDGKRRKAEETPEAVEAEPETPEEPTPTTPLMLLPGGKE